MLEHRYAAVPLASLLTGDPLEELGDPVLVPVEIKHQARQFSKVDDILITARPRQGGEEFRVAIGFRAGRPDHLRSRRERRTSTSGTRTTAGSSPLARKAHP